MKRTRWMLLSCVSVLALVLSESTLWATQEGKKAGKDARLDLPAAVAVVVKENYPHAEIDSVEVEKEAGITLYDIEFKEGQGEIEIAEDGTVMDVATVISMKDLPKGAAEAIQKAGEGAKIKELERSEVRAEIRKEGEKGKVMRLSTPKYVYEAEFVMDNKKGEIEVTAEGKVIETLKWSEKKGKD